MKVALLFLAWAVPTLGMVDLFEVDSDAEPGPCKDENGNPWNEDPSSFGSKTCEYWMNFGLMCDSVWEDTCSEDHPGGFIYNAATLADNPACEEMCPDKCLTKTYAIKIPESKQLPQPLCKGKKAYTCKGETCTKAECRKQCSDDSRCTNYFFGGEGRKTQCFNYHYCLLEQKTNTKITGATYAKICNDYAGTVAVSWGNFAGQERWKTDATAISRVVRQHGGMTVMEDAAGDVSTQNAQIQEFIDQDMDVIIILAEDATQLDTVLANAKEKRIPVIAYDRLIDNEDVFYVTFDNVEVGRLQAQAILEEQPTGKYAFIKGDETDPNSKFVRQGQQEILRKAINKGDIEVVYDEFHAGWSPAIVETEFQEVLQSHPDLAAVVSSNDGMAQAAAKVMAAQEPPINLPLSGQDGDHTAINRVAQGTQTVSVWKDSRELGMAAGELAVQLSLHDTGFQMFKKQCSENDFEFTTPTGKVVQSVLLDPVAITKFNLNVVVEAGWITIKEICDIDPSGLEFCRDFD